MVNVKKQTSRKKLGYGGSEMLRGRGFEAKTRHMLACAFLDKPPDLAL